MNFERGKDPKEAMSIGAETYAIKVKNAGYVIHGSERSLGEVRDNIEFLERLKNMDLPCDSIFGPALIFICNDDGLILELDEIQGKILKYQDQYYEVADTNTILAKGFGHLLKNAGDHRMKTAESEAYIERMKALAASMQVMTSGIGDMNINLHKLMK